jgi:eukaryotic-like serine/threonine-protein kinase
VPNEADNYFAALRYKRPARGTGLAVTIRAGQTLLHYRVVEKIGAGGMGEVYRAEDTRLGRHVAIKVLPAELRHDPHRLARLEREARLLASLNHPHIATLHGLEESADGTRFLVMELVEGETLAARLHRGEVPLRELYTWGAEISDALAAAHERGIVHRDLKPGNIMLTRAGVKLLDFGLAKATTLSAAGALTETRARAAVSDPLTSEGTFLGTVLYMAPEQLEGREADARSDIWALGTVLHEMATRRPAFDGPTIGSVIAAILDREPVKVSKACAIAPRALDHLVATCLVKDPSRRRQSARDLALDLRWLAAEGGIAADLEEQTEMPRARSRRERLLWASLTALLAGVAALAWLIAPAARREAAATGPVRFELPVPGLRWTATESGLALSPQGDAIVYMNTPAPGRPATMWLRELADVEPRPVAGTEDAGNLFWSPDGRRIGFVKDYTIRVVDRAGGPAQTVASAGGDTSGIYTMGPPSWASDGGILFSRQKGDDWEIVRVSADGGEPVVVRPWAVMPSVVPDSRSFLYVGGEGTERTGAVRRGLFMGSLDAKEPASIGVRSRAEYAAGHLFYWDQGVLVARPFDADRASFTGPAVSLGGMPGASFDPTGMAQFSVARDGRAVAYARTSQSVELRWLDMKGNQIGKLGEPGWYESFRISRRADRVAVEVRDRNIGTSDIDVFDLERGVPTRLVGSPEDVAHPTWSPDGQRLAYAGGTSGPPRIFIRRADGSGEAVLLRTSENLSYPEDWSGDGKHIIYTLWVQDREIHVVPANGEEPSRLFAGGRGDQSGARFSPDSRWVAFASSELGATEIFIAPLSDSTAKQRVSVAGGRNPVWSRDGAELYYVNNDTVYAVTFSSRTGQIGTPRALYSLGESFVVVDLDLAPDGQRFLVGVGDRRQSGSVITILLNWQSAIGK